MTKEIIKNQTFNFKLFTKVALLFWAISFLVFFSLFFLIYSTSINLFGLYGSLPPLEILENPKSELASELYSSDGELLGKYFRNNRTPVEYEDISPNVINALLATEDVRFNEHSGIDGRAMLRVFTGIATGNLKGGGSTITQQLAKNLFKMRSEETYEGPLYKIKIFRKILVKVKEWIIAVRLEKSYTKNEIITMYLNTVDFGSNTFGIKVASQTFFGVNQDELKVEEAAVLVGLLKAPTKYSPILNPENSLYRRNTVLNQMKKYNFIDNSTFDSLSKTDIVLNYNIENQNGGLAPYFRTIVRNKLIYWCKERGYDLFSDGLKIYTTLDSKMQKYAEESVELHIKRLQKFFYEHWKDKNPWVDENSREIKNYPETAIKRTSYYRYLKNKYENYPDSIQFFLNKKRKMKVFTWNGEKDTVFSPMDSLKYYKHFLHSGLMAMNPHNGHIKAWVGGINYKYFKFDHVKQGARQPGSTFKPFVYLTAIDNGYSPCYEVLDAPTSFKTEDEKGTWTPPNFENYYSNEMVTIREAMARSMNSVTAFLMKKITPQKVVEYAKRLGITTPLEPVPALCLGVNDVTVYDLVGAYSVFANKGIWTEPQFITRIEDKEGNIIQEFIPKTHEAISEESAYVMLHMLQGATSHEYYEIKDDGHRSALGTAIRLRSREYHKFSDEEYRFEGEIGAKTGTTNNYSDGWFMGVLPDLVTGIWVGADDRSVHFRSGEFGQGSRQAMPIFGHFLNLLYKDSTSNIKPSRFEKPLKELPVEIDCYKYNNGISIDDSSNTNQIYEQPDYEPEL